MLIMRIAEKTNSFNLKYQVYSGIGFIQPKKILNFKILITLRKETKTFQIYREKAMIL